MLVNFDHPSAGSNPLPIVCPSIYNYDYVDVCPTLPPTTCHSFPPLITTQLAHKMDLCNCIHAKTFIIHVKYYSVLFRPQY